MVNEASIQLFNEILGYLSKSDVVNLLRFCIRIVFIEDIQEINKLAGSGVEGKVPGIWEMVTTAAIPCIMVTHYI